MEVGNGLFPSKGNALEAGVTEEELAQLFWAGLATDYARLAAKG